MFMQLNNIDSLDHSGTPHDDPTNHRRNTLYSNLPVIGVYNTFAAADLARQHDGDSSCIGLDNITGQYLRFAL